jgi:colanic acid biosynthesis glycosyl transferase WcaI
MRILMITQLFQPEPNFLKGLAFARELMRRGHEVEVLTGFPNYPGGRLYPGYSMKWAMREELDGVPIVRVPLYPSHDASGLKRFLCYSSFAASASLLGPFLNRRPDMIHVYQGPATLCAPAMVFRVLLGVPYVLDIQDIWPDSVLASGMLRSRVALTALEAYCGMTYQLASKIVVLSEGYRSALVERGVPAEKIQVVYNWCDEQQMLGGTGETEISSALRNSGKFNVVFAGNMGTVQALDSVIQAADLLKDELPQVQFVLVGGGVELDRLKGLVAGLGVENVLFIPRQPITKIRAILDAADVLLIHLKDAPLSRIGIPQKTQAYMAVGKPLIMAVRGESAELLRRSAAGIVCEPENPEAIASAVGELFGMGQDEITTMGRKGAAFYRNELSFGVGTARMLTVFEEAAET